MEKLVKNIVFIFLFVGLQVAIFNMLTAEGGLIPLGEKEESPKAVQKTSVPPQSAMEAVLANPWMLSHEALQPEFRKSMLDSLAKIKKPLD